MRAPTGASSCSISWRHLPDYERPNGIHRRSVHKAQPFSGSWMVRWQGLWQIPGSRLRERQAREGLERCTDSPPPNTLRAVFRGLGPGLGAFSHRPTLGPAMTCLYADNGPVAPICSPGAAAIFGCSPSGVRDGMIHSVSIWGFVRRAATPLRCWPLRHPPVIPSQSRVRVAHRQE